MLVGVNIDGLVGPTVDGQIGLLVTIKIERSHVNTTVDRILPNRSLYSAAMPIDFSRKTHVDGNQPHNRQSLGCGTRRRSPGPIQEQALLIPKQAVSPILRETGARNFPPESSRFGCPNAH